jgi:LPXTG-motif cell wall-anchored protein
MFLQLADNETDTMGGDNYDTLRTDQGNLFIRKDLSAQGKGAKFIGKAAGVLGKVAQFAPLPGAAAISKGLTTISGVAGKVAANKGAGAGAAITAALPKKPFKLPSFKPKAATPTAATPTATMPVIMEQKESFFKRYRTPILIGGGVLLVGAAILILRKKKK